MDQFSLGARPFRARQNFAENLPTGKEETEEERGRERENARMRARKMRTTWRTRSHDIKFAAEGDNVKFEAAMEMIPCRPSLSPHIILVPFSSLSVLALPRSRAGSRCLYVNHSHRLSSPLPPPVSLSRCCYESKTIFSRVLFTEIPRTLGYTSAFFSPGRSLFAASTRVSFDILLPPLVALTISPMYDSCLAGPFRGLIKSNHEEFTTSCKNFPPAGNPPRNSSEKPAEKGGRKVEIVR